MCIQENNKYNIIVTDHWLQEEIKLNIQLFMSALGISKIMVTCIFFITDMFFFIFYFLFPYTKVCYKDNKMDNKPEHVMFSNGRYRYISTNKLSCIGYLGV